MTGLKVPRLLAQNCRRTPERAAWLAGLPDALALLERSWALTLDPPFDHDAVSCAWVAPARLADGTSAILKLGMPHFEAEHELAGLRFWNGDGAVRVLRSDGETGAMLLERCCPGTALSELSEAAQDQIIAGLLRRLWREPLAAHPFRPLSVMLEWWSEETLAAREHWSDDGLVREGLRLFEELPRTARGATREALLATDLHAGNVLRSDREPWLMIDPKPFVGDPAYDVTQHLLNCPARLRSDPRGTIRRVAELSGVDCERVRLWTLARLAAEPRDHWDDEWRDVARALG